MSARIAVPHPSDLDLAPDPKQLARQARLRYVRDTMPGLGRRRAGRGFVFLDVDGGRLKDADHLARIEALVLPPAWQEVWICALPNGHLQATGRDEKGRKQYRYHDRWSRTANWVKFRRLRDFGRELTRIRRQVRSDQSPRKDDRTRTLALMVELLDRTAIRIGNREYAEENEHYGLTTLTKAHAFVRGAAIRFEYLGKSGKERRLEFEDRRIARRLKELLARPGERLFQAAAADGSFAPLESQDVNDYLRDLTPPGCTAKTFRTWRGTVAAFEVLSAACDCRCESFGKAAAKLAESDKAADAGPGKKEIERTLRASIKAAAELLGNTTAVCKSYYVHPALCDLYAEAKLAAHLRKARPKKLAGLKAAELRLLALLDRVDRLRD